MNRESSIAKNFPWPNLIMDFILLFCYYFLLDDLISWQTEHFVLSGVIIILLNIITAAFGIFTFFSIYSSEHESKSYTQFVSTFEGGVIAISVLLTFVSMLWWLVPTQAINKMEAFPIYNGLTALVYFVVNLLILSEAMRKPKYYLFSRSQTAGIISAILNGSFFFFSYGILITSMNIWQPEGQQFIFLGIICLVLFYLPFRIFLLLRPPFHRMEFISFMVLFVVMIERLF
ncbi:MAG: hypothetical protein ACHQFW_03280 [Chitinophagales bacterium]